MRPHIALLVALAAVPLAASAHLAGGVDVTVGGRILDFGFDPATPVAGQPLTLAFNVADASTGTAVAPDDVWIRIADGDAIAFAGTLSPAGTNNVTFSVLAPAAGSYDVTAHYRFGKEMVEGAFPLTVAAAPIPTIVPPKPSALPYVLAAGAGAAAGFALRRLGSRRP